MVTVYGFLLEVMEASAGPIAGDKLYFTVEDVKYDGMYMRKRFKLNCHFYHPS